MTPSRVQLTIRQWMVVIALAALATAWIASVPKRRASFLKIAGEEGNWERSWFLSDDDGPKASEMCHWRTAMQRKYLWAADHPWLPVWPDPPKPR